MLRHERSAPIWLFSFVDLAFLLLIAFTQIGPDADDRTDELATIEIPRIHGPGSPDAAPRDEASWQLRVHPLPLSDDDSAHAPFTLIEPGGGASDATALAAETLAGRLSILETRQQAKPILAPHRDARAEDLLVAAALLDEIWQDGRAVAVRPGPSVALGPQDDTTP